MPPKSKKRPAKKDKEEKAWQKKGKRNPGTGNLVLRHAREDGKLSTRPSTWSSSPWASSPTQDAARVREDLRHRDERLPLREDLAFRARSRPRATACSSPASTRARRTFPTR